MVVATSLRASPDGTPTHQRVFGVLVCIPRFFLEFHPFFSSNAAGGNGMGRQFVLGNLLSKFLMDPNESSCVVNEVPPKIFRETRFNFFPI